MLHLHFSGVPTGEQLFSSP